MGFEGIDEIDEDDEEEKEDDDDDVEEEDADSRIIINAYDQNSVRKLHDGNPFPRLLTFSE